MSEMNGLEVDFLFRINFSLHVTPEVFEKYRSELLSQATPVQAMILQQASRALTPEFAPSPQIVVQTNPVNPQAPPVVCCAPPPPTAEITIANALRCKLPIPTHITPSPPAEAARDTLEFQRNQQQQAVTSSQQLVECFPLQRSHSMPPSSIPPAPSASYFARSNIPSLSSIASASATQPQNRSAPHQSSFSAPPIIAAGAAAAAAAAMQLPTIHQLASTVNASEDQYIAMMEQQLYPLQQSSLIHHHHGDYARQAVKAQAQQMLAGAGS